MARLTKTVLEASLEGEMDGHVGYAKHDPAGRNKGNSRNGSRLWAGEHGDGEGAKFWLRVLTEIKNRGVADVCMVVCDGLKGLPDAIAATWPQTVTQTCIVHLLRNSFRYASRKVHGLDRGSLAARMAPPGVGRVGRRHDESRGRPSGAATVVPRRLGDRAVTQMITGYRVPAAMFDG